MQSNARISFLASIKAKLYFSVFLTIFSLLLISATAFYKANNMALSAERIYKVSLKNVSMVGEIKSLYRIAQGAIARAPAELDQDRVKELGETADSKITEALSVISAYTENLDDDGIAIISVIKNSFESMKAEGDKVFEFASLFAADQANEVLNTTFKEIEDVMKVQLVALGEYEAGRAEVSYNTLLDAQKTMYQFVALIFVVAVLIAGGFSFITAKNVGLRTGKLTHSMSTLADGDVDSEIPYISDHDEIGNMAKAVLVFKENKIRADRLSEEQEEDNKAQLERAKKMQQYTYEFDIRVKEAINSLLASSDELRETSENMKKTSEETKAESSVIASATEESSANIHTVSETVDELTAAIQEISSQILSSTNVSRDVSVEVESAMHEIESLLQASESIGEVIVLIQDIAEQTNLLALNATIEAARAGDAGKGFAVVATEVKSLAGETASATDRISLQIKTVQEQTQNAVAAVDSVKNRILELNEISTILSSAVEQQNAATIKISQNSQEATVSAQEVNRSIHSILDKVGDAEDVSKNVLKASAIISEKNHLLTNEISDFLEKVKSL